jgi:hypothetical protein
MPLQMPLQMGGSPLRTRSSNSPVVNRSRVSCDESSMPPSSIKRPKSAANSGKRKNKMTYTFGSQNATGSENKNVTFEAKSRKRSSSRGRTAKVASRRSPLK